MRRKFFVFLTSIFLTGCSINGSPTIFHNPPKLEDPIIEHSYNEVEDKHILWSEIFEQEPEIYFVYFYSLNCDHCENMKNEIIDLCLKRDDVFFVKSSNQVVLKNDVFYTIGVGNVGDFDTFVAKSDLIISNRIDPKLKPFGKKVFTRDLYNRD